MTKENKIKAYNELAKYVDAIYGIKHNYNREIRFIEKMFKTHKLKPGLIYDVACGSGRHSKILMKKGYRVVGVDLNSGMIKLAKKNVPKLKVYKQDMRKLNMKKKSECIITMFNAINHLKDYSDFERMLRAYYKNLQKGGLIIFDTMWNPKNWSDGFYNARKYKINDTIIIKADSSFNIRKNKGFVRQVFVVWKGKSKKAKIIETTWVNFLFDIKQIKKISKKIGFKVNLYYDFSISAKKKKNSSYVFVLEKL